MGCQERLPAKPEKKHMSRQHKISGLNKFLRYLLERRPDEFGLIPDEIGWISLKSLVQALSETDDWRHIGKTDISELLFYPDCGIEIENNNIRAKNRQNLPLFQPCADVPGILYLCVRRRAYPIVLEKGVLSGPGGRIICCPDRELTQRIGKRFDPRPVLLTIHARSAAALEIKFCRFGESMFLCDRIPTEAFTGPTLADILKPRPEKGTKTEQKKITPQKHPGTFIITPEMAISRPGGKTGKGQKKKISWKEGRRQAGRHKKQIDKHNP